jgi:hypothetical protein
VHYPGEGVYATPIDWRCGVHLDVDARVHQWSDLQGRAPACQAADGSAALLNKSDAGARCFHCRMCAKVLDASAFTKRARSHEERAVCRLCNETREHLSASVSPQGQAPPPAEEGRARVCRKLPAFYKPLSAAISSPRLDMMDVLNGGLAPGRNTIGGVEVDLLPDGTCLLGL